VEPATPYEDEQRDWLAWARGLVAQGRTLVAIVATHHHIDHVGGLDVLSRELDVPVWAHAETRSRLGPREQERVTRTLWEDETLSLSGPETSAWRVLHTPGHAPGHVCLLEQSGSFLVVGDMVATEGTILIAPGDGDMTTYLEQLKRLAALNANVALPAHGAPISTPKDLFERYIAHRLGREARVFAALQPFGDEGIDLDGLLPAAYADTPREIWRLARMSLEAHLEKLERDGRVIRLGPARFRVG
jgi:glyoxylase-like metal-dependent hydrolase (beta-lactamase superfamily II)